jgi:hypothetical protein
MLPSILDFAGGRAQDPSPDPLDKNASITTSNAGNTIEPSYKRMRKGNKNRRQKASSFMEREYHKVHHAFD